MMKTVPSFLHQACRHAHIGRPTRGLSLLATPLLLLGLHAPAAAEKTLTVSLTESHLVIGQAAVIHWDAGPPIQESEGQKVSVRLRGDAVGPERALTLGKGIRTLREDRITVDIPPDLSKGKTAQLQVVIEGPEGLSLSNVLSFTAVVAHISGRVIRMVNGTPIAGAKVEAAPGDVSGFTNEGGFYTLSLDKGIYTVHASAPDFVTREARAVDTHAGAAEVFFELEPDFGTLNEAVRHAQQKVEANPADGQARFELGTAYQQVGQWSEAIAALSRAVELRPDHIEARHQLAFSYWRTYQYARAKEVCLQALEIDAQHQGLQTLLRRLEVEGY